MIRPPNRAATASCRAAWCCAAPKSSRCSSSPAAEPQRRLKQAEVAGQSRNEQQSKSSQSTYRSPSLSHSSEQAATLASLEPPQAVMLSIGTRSVVPRSERSEERRVGKEWRSGGGRDRGGVT